MTERVIHRNPYRGEAISLEDLPPHGLIDLIADQDGLSVSVRLDHRAATALRDALSEWLTPCSCAPGGC